MLVRQVVVPASPEELWDALTEPDSVAAWFGARVDWDLRPGGMAHFVGDDGSVRDGVVEAVRRGRHLRFRWWPEPGGVVPPEGGETDTGTEVTYNLEADREGTRLTVTEQRLVEPAPKQRLVEPAPESAANDDRPEPGQAGAAVRARAPRCGDGEHGAARSSAADSPAFGLPMAADPAIGVGDTEAAMWTDWDGRLFQFWAYAAAPALVGRQGR